MANTFLRNIENADKNRILNIENSNKIKPLIKDKSIKNNNVTL